MPTYLVTGAAGFIGAKVCEFLLAEGHTVVGIDNLNNYYDVRLKDYRLAGLLGHRAGNAETLKAEKRKSEWRPGGDPRVSMYAGKWRLDSMQGANITVDSPQLSGGAGFFVFEQIDIENLPALERLFKEFKFDAVFNLAARAGVRYSMDNPHVYMTTNAHGTLNLLECLRKFGVKKFVLASTSSLYAGCPMPFTEDQPVNTPLSPYAASKKAAEAMAYSYHYLYGIDVSVLRYFTVYGPAGRPDMAPYRFVHWIATGEPIKLFGDGLQTRDFTYVDDIARGTILAACCRNAETLKTEKLKPDGVRQRGDGRTAGAARSGAEGEAQREPASGVATSKPERLTKHDNAKMVALEVRPWSAAEGRPRPGAPRADEGANSDLRTPISKARTPGFEVINLGGGNEPITIKAMIEMIEDYLGKKAKIVHLPPNASDMTDTQANISKAEELIRWKPEISPADGFKHTVAWYLRERAWLGGIGVEGAASRPESGNLNG